MSGQVCIYYILCLNLCKKKNNTVDNFLNIQRGNHSNLWSLSTLFLMIFSLHIQFSHLGAMAPPPTNLYILDKETGLIYPSSLIRSIPTSACTIVSDPSCTQVRNIMCNDVPPLSECKVHLTRRFLEPGTYCVNITLENSSSLTLTSTTITINKSQDTPG